MSKGWATGNLMVGALICDLHTQNRYHLIEQLERPFLHDDAECAAGDVYSVDSDVHSDLAATGVRSLDFGTLTTLPDCHVCYTHTADTYWLECCLHRTEHILLRSAGRTARSKLCSWADT